MAALFVGLLDGVISFQGRWRCFFAAVHFGVGCGGLWLGGARLGGAAFFALSAVAFWLLRWVAVLGTVGVAYWEVISVISSTIRY